MPTGRKIKENEGALFGFSEEEWASFHKCKRYRIRHPEKQKQAVAKWAATKPPEYHHARARKSQLKLSYGLTPEDYEVMLKQQQGQCSICNTKTPTGRWKVFAVDHCHMTGRVRGLLCNECNRGIGLLGDDTERLLKAVAYLEYHKAKTKKEQEQ